MVTCELCNKTGDDLSLREANLKEQGKKWVCQDCWTQLYNKNNIVAGSSGGSAPSCGMGCKGCRHA
jgi:hypothetical protein